jgi:hypothetical protein
MTYQQRNTIRERPFHVGAPREPELSYIECDLPDGVTLQAWKRARAPRSRRHFRFW